MSRRTAANDEQIFLRERRRLDENQRRAHPEKNGLQQADVLLDDHPVHHHLGEDREEQFEKSDGDREQQHLQEESAELGQEGQHPGESRLALRSARERVGVIEKRGVTRPILLEFLARNFAQARAGSATRT